VHFLGTKLKTVGITYPFVSRSVARRLIDISKYDFPAIFEMTDRDGG
jgi:hypothetical protein